MPFALCPTLWAPQGACEERTLPSDTTNRFFTPFQLDLVQNVGDLGCCQLGQLCLSVFKLTGVQQCPWWSAEHRSQAHKRPSPDHGHARCCSSVQVCSANAPFHPKSRLACPPQHIRESSHVEVKPERFGWDLPSHQNTLSFCSSLHQEVPHLHLSAGITINIIPMSWYSRIPTVQHNGHP